MIGARPIGVAPVGVGGAVEQAPAGHTAHAAAGAASAVSATPARQASASAGLGGGAGGAVAVRAQTASASAAGGGGASAQARADRLGLSVVLFRDSGADAIASIQFNNNQNGARMPFGITKTVRAASVSATTFKVRAGGNGAATTRFNASGGAALYGGTLASFIEVTEILT